jgi:hypothetical protein
MHFNTTLIFGAYLPNTNNLTTNYEESVSKIQRIIGFFQRQSVFDRSLFPDLPAGIEKLVFELVSLNLEQLPTSGRCLGGSTFPRLSTGCAW